MTKNIILEALMAEATVLFERKLKAGTPPAEALEEVSDDMALTSDETSELTDRLNSEMDADVEPVSAEPVVPQEPVEDSLRPFTIYFINAEEAEQATGMLMYRKVAWVSKGVDEDSDSAVRPFIQFENQENLDKAHDALGRRWDFVDNAVRKVAMIQFDNMVDYLKVVDFMKKSKMFVEYDENVELDADLMDTPDNMVSANSDDEPVAIEPSSFVAKNRDTDWTATLSTTGNRFAKVRRLWK